MNRLRCVAIWFDCVDMKLPWRPFGDGVHHSNRRGWQHRSHLQWTSPAWSKLLKSGVVLLSLVLCIIASENANFHVAFWSKIFPYPMTNLVRIFADIGSSQSPNSHALVGRGAFVSPCVTTQFKRVPRYSLMVLVLLMIVLTASFG